MEDRASLRFWFACVLVAGLMAGGCSVNDGGLGAGGAGGPMGAGGVRASGDAGVASGGAGVASGGNAGTGGMPLTGSGGGAPVSGGAPGSGGGMKAGTGGGVGVSTGGDGASGGAPGGGAGSGGLSTGGTPGGTGGAHDGSGGVNPGSGGASGSGTAGSGTAGGPGSGGRAVGSGGVSGSGGATSSCNATTCPDGCCAEGRCVTNLSDSRCGNAGAACAPCGNCFRCSARGICGLVDSSRWQVICASATIAPTRADGEMWDSSGNPLPDAICRSTSGGETVASQAAPDTLSPTWNESITPRSNSGSGGGEDGVSASNLMSGSGANSSGRWSVAVVDEDSSPTLSDQVCAVTPRLTEADFLAGSVTFPATGRCLSLTLRLTCAE